MDIASDPVAATDTPTPAEPPVIRREDGSWLYMLPSVVDDIDLAITHIVRGEDHVTNSAIQMQMFDALGADRPQLAHEALLVASEGKLSKRLGSVGVEAMKERGLEPMALLSLLARIGTSQPVEPSNGLAHMARGLDFGHFGRAPAQFSFDEVELLNAKLLHTMKYDAVRDRLPDGIGEAEWEALKGNLERLSDIQPWAQILHGDIDPPQIDDEDRDYLNNAARIAGLITFDADVWTSLTAALKEETGRKGRALFMPLRRALTGLDHGPELGPLLPILGREETLRRLS